MKNIRVVSNRRIKICVFMLMLIALFFVAFTLFNKADVLAKTDDVRSVSAEEYTSSDNLLDYDGDRLEKNILDFADEVHNADMHDILYLVKTDGFVEVIV